LTIIDESAESVEIGRTRVDKELIKFARDASLILRENMGFDWREGIKTPSNASGEIMILMNDGWILRLSQDTEPQEYQHILQAIFDNEVKKEDLPNLEYLDLRIKGRAYYKYK
jgi:hypothetical protein